MSENESFVDCLESVIKVEPEEFEILEDDVPPEQCDNNRTISESAEKSCSQSENLAENVGLAGTLECCICQKVFKRRSFLMNHLENFHYKTNKMCCDLCPKFCFTKHSIKQHMITHGDRKFKCNICGYGTPFKASFEKHQKIHGAKVECQVCHKQVSAIKSHMRMHAPKQRCPICQTILTKQSMANHLKTHRPEFSCPICKKMYTKPAIKKHMKTHNKNKKCDSCEENFENREDLRMHHLRKHYDGKVFECHCGLIYSSKRALQFHQKSHADKKLSCSVCNKLFSSIRYLKRHCKNNHGDPGIESLRVLCINGPFICDKCGSKHRTRKTFQMHMNRVHGHVKRFCDLCPRSYSQKHFLVDHMNRVHLKRRPFECNICRHSSSTQSDLRMHLLSHKPKTECQICHKSFKFMKDHLRTHVRAKCTVCDGIVAKKNLDQHMKLHTKSK